eukprot:TRINITY_DN2278_c0_g1_i1.p1 TRINITY_DN2278_c0_g1~~TRINITY_DN2278_c0_g1_i1.p1  ORF type:complete len:216 (+),score=21.22 TRINITY_DN2278_c0_g1_i1:36-683(+)
MILYCAIFLIGWFGDLVVSSTVRCECVKSASTSLTPTYDIIYSWTDVPTWTIAWVSIFESLHQPLNCPYDRYSFQYIQKSTGSGRLSSLPLSPNQDYYCSIYTSFECTEGGLAAHQAFSCPSDVPIRTKSKSNVVEVVAYSVAGAVLLVVIVTAVIVIIRRRRLQAAAGESAYAAVALEDVEDFPAQPAASAEVQEDPSDALNLTPVYVATNVKF